MAYGAAWLVLLACVSVVLSDPIACDPADFVNSKCKCGDTTYDFSQIKNTDGSKMFRGPNGDYVYFFEMDGLPSSITGCTFDPQWATGTVGGQGTADGSTCYPIGVVKEQTWTLNPASGSDPQNILVVFNGGQDGRQTWMKAICDSTTHGSFTANGETAVGSQIYEVDIRTCAACPGPNPCGGGGSGGSTSTSTSIDVGWILIIVLICSLFVYFVGGMVFLKYRRQASGREMVPNVEFWSSLPGLVKDGFLFTVAKVRRTEYQPL